MPGDNYGSIKHWIFEHPWCKGTQAKNCL